MMGRHGRNVRQRVAEAEAREVAQMKAQAERRRAELALLYDMRDKLHDAEEFNREVARIVGRTSILAGAPTHHMFSSLTRKDVCERGIQVPLTPKYMAYCKSEPDLGLYALEQVRVEVLHMLDFEVVQDQMRAAMHMRVTLAGGEVRYALSRQAMRTLDREELVRRLVNELLLGLAQKLGR